MWQTLGGTGFCSLAPWPDYDEAKTVAATVEVAVQINGKLRGVVALPVGADKETALSIAKADEKVAAALAGKTIVKEIYVKGRIINIVVK
jgi:leucyl-tRNA synthetase